jgi:hypothetical protein
MKLHSIVRQSAAVLLVGWVVTPAIASEPSLRIVRESRPDAVALHKDLATRLGGCQMMLKAQGMAVPNVQLPSIAMLEKLVTMQEEVLIDGDRVARFSNSWRVMPDPSMGCKVRLARLPGSASVTERCKSAISGVAATANVSGSAEPPSSEPELSEEKYDGSFTAHCKSAKFVPPKPSDAAYIKAKSPLGFACYWIESPGNVTKPSIPGVHSCLHPRALTARLDENLSLWTVYVPDPKHNKTIFDIAYDTGYGASLAVVVDEGKPLPAGRMTKAAVEKFTKQPAWVDLGVAP